MDMDDRDCGESDSTNGDGDGVWSPDIEQSFHEALRIYPPCGRRKHILQEEGGGKMYGRNELIARHIQMRTGKSRTRKQVSSHIQVLARRKAKATQSGNSNSSSLSGLGGGLVSPSPSSGSIGISAAVTGGTTSAAAAAAATSINSTISNRTLSSSSSAMVVHQSHHQPQHHYHHIHHQQQPPTNNNNNNNSGSSQSLGGSLQTSDIHGVSNQVLLRQQLPTSQQPYYDGNDIWLDRAIATQKIRLVEFSAFIEYRNFQPSNINKRQLAAGGVTINNNTGAGSGIVGGGLTTTSAANHQLPPQQQQQQLHRSLATSSVSAQISGAGGNGTHCTPVTVKNEMHHHNNNQHHNNQHHNNQQQQPHQLSAGFTRHSYVKIDYRIDSSNCGSGGGTITNTLTGNGGALNDIIGGGGNNRQQANLLEKIAISQIQDKFPGIGGPDGLFQQGPSDAFFLIKFWADLNNDHEYNINDQNSFFGFSSQFETVDPYRDITCSIQACSYGLKVVEKVEKIYSAFNSLTGRYSYELNRSPMCEFMVQFIKKLRELPRPAQMNSVLENFTVLQVITRESTPEILLCLAYVFEVASTTTTTTTTTSSSMSQSNQQYWGQSGPQYHVYKLNE